jgi:aminopeptidase N
MVLAVAANRRQAGKGREAVGVASDILRFYSSLVGDAPYDALTIAMVESTLPGGHSPAYVVMLNNPAPMSPYTWRNDPAAFSNYPEFYLAHEIAHQWWGQAVGWQNYHEQWLSEGLSQYFAALFARDRRGEQAFREVIRQFRRWGLAQSDQGPIYLGYRLGHLKNDSRVFRAVVYNKSASVLHMLRRLIGDDAFFRGLRRYYADNRYKKAGTADLQRAMEAESGGLLERFFQRWIFEDGIPRVRYSTAIDGDELVVRFEQVGISDDAPLYDLPVTVAITDAEGTVEEIVALRAATVEKRFPLTGTLKNVEVNADGAALAEFDRR